MNRPIKLSIIILNYNTKELTENCIRSIIQNTHGVMYEIIICDNGSTDGSVEYLSQRFGDNITIIENGANIGFAKGNNAARKIVKGEYVLFLNSDTIVHTLTLQKCVRYLDERKDIGALTCKAVLSNGLMDKDTRRSFITPWIGLVHLFLHLDKVFPRSKIFAQYWYGYIDENVTHEIDAIQGAFFMSRKNVLDQVDWYDEDYFLDAEDIDLSWKIKKAGWRNMYYPEVSITHLKGATKGKNRNTKNKISLREKLKYRLSGVNSMEIFYKKRMWNENPIIVNYLVLVGINFLKVIRTLKVVVIG